jgi:hypothetical protein
MVPVAEIAFGLPEVDRDAAAGHVGEFRFHENPPTK